MVLLLRAAVQRLSDSCRHKSSGGKLLERVLFNGTQFSNLYTTVDTPARGCVWVCVVFVCKYVLGHSRVSQPLNLRLSAIMLTWDFFKISCSELEHACSTGKIPCQHAAPFPDGRVCDMGFRALTPTGQTPAVIPRGKSSTNWVLTPSVIILRVTDMLLAPM